MRAVVIAATSAILALGCTPGARDHLGANGDGGPGTNPDGKLATDGGPSSTSDAPLDDGSCSDNSKLVYVLSSVQIGDGDAASTQFSQFDPMTKKFHDIGYLDCDEDGSPFSMAIDRNAVAWVEYSNGKIYKVNTTTLACTQTTWSAQLGLNQFGMGFSTDTVGGSTDTLFIGGGKQLTSNTDATSTLASLNTATLSATMVGTVNGWPELTGTGNAELWGFFPDDSAPRVDQINKTNGSALQSFPEKQLAGTPAAYAFAFWGGDFYIFLEQKGEFYSTVHHINGTTGAKVEDIDGDGHVIVGAGVSTCAPTVLQ